MNKSQLIKDYNETLTEYTKVCNEIENLNEEATRLEEDLDYFKSKIIEVEK